MCDQDQSMAYRSSIYFILSLILCSGGALIKAHAQIPSVDQPQDQNEQNSLLDSSQIKSDQALNFVESEQLLSRAASWRQNGFRVDLGYYSETIKGIGSAPSGTSQGVRIGFGARLDDEWSLSGSRRVPVPG